MSKLVVISGPSGVGKGTIVKMLKKRYEDEGKKLYISISCTTRLPREHEVDKVDYFFISEEEFLNRLQKNDFLEYNCYGTGKYYGTPLGMVNEYLQNGYDVILEIDVNGYQQVKEKYPECIGIFVMAPTMEDLYRRLKNRGTEDEAVIKKRLNTAEEEIKKSSVYEYIVINEENKELETLQKVYDIINQK